MSLSWWLIIIPLMVDFNSMKRRDLLKTLSLSAAGAALAGLGGACAPVRPLAGKLAVRKHSAPERKPCSVSRRPDPVAIAMWDFSWLLRHHPCGEFEGWGAINWLDHPALTWEVVQQAGEICARLGRKHGYRFNCTSNFTHPQFPRLWRDVAWHRRVTDIIRQG